eukprot:TRINITY_DN2456_c0_g1_i7.p1 TRINITY_DN2456_c0_g1~~TRINITY_DN2456_c0_g1_i7.p1  ORF type:complete len:261 (+),score=26.63 TRINITY_DN2456_c0_g1_i7:111-893(+)
MRRCHPLRWALLAAITIQALLSSGCVLLLPSSVHLPPQILARNRGLDVIGWSSAHTSEDTVADTSSTHNEGGAYIRWQTAEVDAATNPADPVSEPVVAAHVDVTAHANAPTKTPTEHWVDSALAASDADVRAQRHIAWIEHAAGALLNESRVTTDEQSDDWLDENDRSNGVDNELANRVADCPLVLEPGRAQLDSLGPVFVKFVNTRAFAMERGERLPTVHERWEAAVSDKSGLSMVRYILSAATWLVLVRPLLRSLGSP